MSRDALIIGGSKQIGRAVVETLLPHGWTVTTFDRGNAGVPADWADRGVRAASATASDPTNWPPCSPTALPRLVEFYGDRFVNYAAEDALLARLGRSA